MSQQTAAAEQAPPAGRENLDTHQRRDEARRMYRESIDAELPMTARALGRVFGRSERWGRDRINEVRNEPPRSLGSVVVGAAPTAELTNGSGMPSPNAGMPTTATAAPATDVIALAEAAPAADDPAPELTKSVGMPTGTGAAGRWRRPRPWPLVLLALPAFVAVWSGWVGIGRLTGFGVVNLLPGIVPDGGWATIDTAITLPIGVEAYGAYALSVWLSGAVPARARRFAFFSALGSLLVGMAGQGAYHLMIANPQWLDRSGDGTQSAPWPIVVLVSCLPVAVLGMGAALAHLVRAADHDPQRR